MFTPQQKTLQTTAVLNPTVSANATAPSDQNVTKCLTFPPYGWERTEHGWMMTIMLSITEGIWFEIMEIGNNLLSVIIEEFKIVGGEYRLAQKFEPFFLDRSKLQDMVQPYLNRAADMVGCILEDEC